LVGWCSFAAHAVLENAAQPLLVVNRKVIAKGDPSIPHFYFLPFDFLPFKNIRHALLARFGDSLGLADIA